MKDSQPLGSIPKVKTYGHIIYRGQKDATSMTSEILEVPLDDDCLLSYMIIPRYEMNLENLFANVKINQQQILILALQLLTILEQIHIGGYVYNDLKLDNIMIQVPQGTPPNSQHYREISFDKNSISLIDFGFATKYIDSKTGLHL